MFPETRTVAQMKADLVAAESQIAVKRAEQSVLIRELERAQATQSDGSRSMVEWVQSNLDVHRDVAADLVYAGRRLGRHRGVAHLLADGRCTFDRAVATLRYAESGATPGDLHDSFDHDLAGVSRLTTRRHHVTRHDEHRVFMDRYFVVQPTLDESMYRMWGRLPGVMGRTVEKAIIDKADELRRTAEATGVASTRGQRQADALAMIAQDSIERTTDSDTDSGFSSSPHVTVFVDASVDDPTEMGGSIAFGPRVGPQTLEQMLCSGRVQVVGLDDGTPVVASHATRAIPPAIRHRVAQRDGGCTIDGCTSRYRLEPHHIRSRAHGGSHEIDNLATLCWYHHHVAIHGNGYHIDPEAPPQRRRLIRGSPMHGSRPG